MKREMETLDTSATSLIDVSDMHIKGKQLAVDEGRKRGSIGATLEIDSVWINLLSTHTYVDIY